MGSSTEEVSSCVSHGVTTRSDMSVIKAGLRGPNSKLLDNRDYSYKEEIITSQENVTMTYLHCHVANLIRAIG